jgi:parallel beta-helix repeat protein
MPSEGRGGAGTARRRRIARAAVVVLVLAGAASGVVPAVRAASIPCGTLITKSTKLTSDIGPCTAGGLVIGGHDITLDLNGHRVFGTSVTGDGIGIELVEASGAVLTHGTVSNFDAGIVIVRGGGNRIEQVKAVANIGQDGATAFGDGILIDTSSANVVTRNEIRSNGPFSGISVIGTGSDGNKITKNVVQNNDVATNGTEQNDVGIRLEAGTAETTVKSNLVSFNGLDGVAIFQNSVRNVLVDNTVKGNGFHDKAHRKGDGIRVFGGPGPDDNTLRSNVASDNAGHGIVLSVGATANLLQRNKATGNGFLEPGAADLSDLNPGCDGNAWLRNDFRSHNQGCVT